jgi:hypothetical protein
LVEWEFLCKSLPGEVCFALGAVDGKLLDELWGELVLDEIGYEAADVREKLWGL